MTGAPTLAIGALTDTGRVRELNEDSIGTPDRMGISEELLASKGELLAVADGMGGHAAGEVASQEAIRTLYAEYYDDPSTDVARSLRRAVEKANAHIHDQALSDQSKQGMGTTLVAAVIQGSRLVVANVGDSRAYLFRGEELRQITRDHSWVAETLAAGLLTEKQAKTHAYRNLITRALGQGPEVEVDLFQERLRAGDVLFLCSDGLSNEVDDDRIARVLSQGSPVESARSLMILANRGGGRDNISVVVAGMPSGRERLQAMPVPALALGILALVAIVGLALALWMLGPWPGENEGGGRQGPTTAATAELIASPVSTEAGLPTLLPTQTNSAAPEPTATPPPTATIAPTDSATPPPSPTATPPPTATVASTDSATPPPSPTSSPQPSTTPTPASSPAQDYSDHIRLNE